MWGPKSRCYNSQVGLVDNPATQNFVEVMRKLVASDRQGFNGGPDENMMRMFPGMTSMSQ